MNVLRNSSVYSISRIYRSPICFSKVLWILSLISCLGTGFIKVANICYKYLEYPVVVNLNVLIEQELEFPAITVCNLNRMKRDPFQATITGYGKHPQIGEGEPLRFSERRDLYQCKKKQESSINTEEKNNSYLEFLKKWYHMDKDERFAAGHDPSLFIKECTFNGKICPKQYFSTFSNLRYGNCVTFNKKTDKLKVLKSSKNGIKNGLVLGLNLQKFNYMKSTPTLGTKLIIHDPADIATPEEKGYFIPPGYETAIGLKQTIFKRLQSPYKDQCVDYNARSKEFPRSKDECIRKCIQKRSFVQCGCIDPTFGLISNFKSCDLSNTTESCCLDDVLEYMSQSGPTCNCPLPCSYVSYGEELSKSLLSSEKSKGIHHPSFYGLVKVTIFYSSFEKQVYEQRPCWEISEFLSILGNEFGLWLGSSLIIFVEILDSLFLFAKYVIAHLSSLSN